MIRLHGEQRDSRKRWLKLSGGGALVFFLVKGIVWLAIAAAAGISAWTR